jgi:L-serine deaminase
MLFKRGSTISAAEGGCQAEVGGEETPFTRLDPFNESPIVACSMAAAGFAACMGAPPETVLQVGRLLNLLR